MSAIDLCVIAVDCTDCDDAMSEDEIRYYGNRCETCEEALMQRIERWRGGALDGELERAFLCNLRAVH